MKRSVSVAALSLLAVMVLFAVAPMFAQAPKGWMVRTDHSMNASDPDAAGDVKFVTMGSGFHATNPRAAVYWNPANSMTGNYTVKGTLKLVKAGSHSEYYGLIIGGSDLGGPAQSYLYFMIAADGTFLIKRRNGDSTETIAPATDSSAVKTPDASGQSTNALEVRVMSDKIEYAINGTVVKSVPKTGPASKTDGIYGIRVNHMLEVHIDGFSASKM